MTPAQPQSAAQVPPAFPGFRDIKRYWDKSQGFCVAQVLPGEYYVTQHDEAIATVLGSCVAVCVRDPEVGIGGMNHFMLPEDRNEPKGATWARSNRFGAFAMERLLNSLLSRGGRRGRLELKVFGGGRILGSPAGVGSQNIAFIREFLRLEGLPIEAEDLGGDSGRRIQYFPRTGRARVKLLTTGKADDITQQEMHYQSTLRKERATADVELF